MEDKFLDLYSHPRFNKNFEKYERGELLGRGSVANGGVYEYKY